MSSFLTVVCVGGPRNPTNIFLFYFSATMQGMESSLQQPHTVANILAPVRNIDLEPQTQSRMQCKFTEGGIRGLLRNNTKEIIFVH